MKENRNKVNEFQPAMKKISPVFFNVLYAVMIASFLSRNGKSKAEVITEVSNSVENFSNVGDSLYRFFLERKADLPISRMELFTGGDFKTCTLFQYVNAKQVDVSEVPFSEIRFLKKIISFPKAYFIDLYLSGGYIAITLDVPELRVSKHRTIYRYYFRKDIFEQERKADVVSKEANRFYLRDGVVIDFVRY